MPNSTSNVNPVSGIRYGVISGNSLDQDLLQDLLYGSDATDLDYEAAYDDARADAEAEFDRNLGEAEIAASETDANMTEGEREQFIVDWLGHQGLVSYRESHIDGALEQFSECYQGDEPNVEGEFDGVKYLISWLGGAPLVWIIEGPVGYADRLCSPCVPNAADLDSGYTLVDEFSDGHDGFPCYVAPRDWLEKED